MTSKITARVLTGLFLATFAASQIAFGTPPSTWSSRGIGGGGAFFGPSISPHNPNEIYVACDMSDAFRSRDSGASWTMLNFRELRGHMQMSGVQYTSLPNVLYALDATLLARSTDGGETWTDIATAIEPVYCVFADPASSSRLLFSDGSKIYFSTDSGATYATVYSGSSLHVAGAFFDGNSVFIGTSAGLLVSTDGGRTFTKSSIGGIPSGEAMASFTGAKQNGTTRLLCVTWDASTIYPGVSGAEMDGYKGVYRLDYGVSTAWSKTTTGIGTSWMSFVGMARGNISVAYAAGTTVNAAYPAVYRSTDGGSSWLPILQVTRNGNVATGWRGDSSDPDPNAWQKWWWGEYIIGFNVCPSDPQRVIISDYGFVHLTTNGGVSWSQVYVDPRNQNPANTLVPYGKSYQSSGLENTAAWSLTWANSATLIGSFTDIHGIRSGDGGLTWSFPTGLVLNTTYECVRHPTNGFLYATISSIHNLYAYDEATMDVNINGGSGSIVCSKDQGINWTKLPGFKYPAVSLAIDPSNPNRMYVSGVNKANGGIFLSRNFQSGASTTWTKLANPPRTQGHPFVVRVLKDGTVVCSYSGRYNNGDFTASSGVFVSTNGGASWMDRTAAGMKYFTQDVVIDPTDPTQNTWYAGVWREWYSSKGSPGLYRTTNRGLTWTRINSTLECVGSCTVNPSNGNEMYVTTKYEGLWYSANAKAASPTFTEVTSYPFKHPTRVFFNPYNNKIVWVASWGAGLMMGQTL
jgi:hypothetical protein